MISIGDQYGRSVGVIFENVTAPTQVGVLFIITVKWISVIPGRDETN